MVKRGAVRIGFRAAIMLLLTGLAGLSPGAAQQRKDGEPGEFDFYVLALSWSPSYCASVEERAADRRRRPDQRGLTPSSCTGSGRNTSAASHPGARCPRRASRAQWLTACLT
jgi:hypothetical protein